MSVDILAKLKEARVVPVAVFDSVDDSLRISEMLLERGIGLMEITMRTTMALDCMEAVAVKVPEITMGAGSVFDGPALRDARQAGAGFAVAAGFDEETVKAAVEMDFPFVPGVATPSEFMAALRYCAVIKIFPAALLGGVSYINAIAAPFASRDFHLIPTGGINEKNYQDYLKAAGVAACGMSYIVERKLLQQKDYGSIGSRMDEIVSGLKSME